MNCKNTSTGSENSSQNIMCTNESVSIMAYPSWDCSGNGTEVTIKFNQCDKWQDAENWFTLNMTANPNPDGPTGAYAMSASVIAAALALSTQL